MTLPDEKVVAWMTPGGDVSRSFNWCYERCMPPAAPIGLIRRAAYAELAADRDLWRSMATFEGKVSASVLEDLHTTQAQLAELREKVVGLAEHYDWLFQTEQDDEMSGRHIANELRTLAAADGATTGEMKCPTP